MEFVLPVRIADGQLTGRIPLPAGSYLMRLRGAVGATTFWGDASEGTVISVSQEAADVQLEVAGAQILLRVTEEMGNAVQEYEFIVNGPNVSGTLATWRDVMLEMAPDGARAFWLSPGDHRIGIRKAGFKLAIIDLEVPTGGVSVPLEIRLEREVR